MSSTINGSDMSIPGTLTVGAMNFPGATNGQFMVSDADGNVTPQTVSVSGIFSGELALPSGQASGSVTGLALGFTPVRVMVVIRKPAGGYQIWVSIVDGTLTTDGFDFELSAPPPDSSYILDYIII